MLIGNSLHGIYQKFYLSGCLWRLRFYLRISLINMFYLLENCNSDIIVKVKSSGVKEKVLCACLAVGWSLSYSFWHIVICNFTFNKVNLHWLAIHYMVYIKNCIFLGACKRWDFICHVHQLHLVRNNRVYFRVNQHTKIIIFRNLLLMVFNDKLNACLPCGLLW